MKKREPYNAIKYANDGILLTDKLDWETRKIQFLGIKSRIQIMQENVDEAEKTINEAEKLVSKVGKYRIVSFFYSDYLIGMFSCNLSRLERSIVKKDIENILKNKKAALKSGRIAAKYSKKNVAADSTEACKLMGIYYWLINIEEKAFKWWNSSIKEGERIGAKLELSRTYLEVGKRLTEPNSKFRNLNGIKAESYLEKARAMFEEMDLQWDLDELEKITLTS
jgi:hypothetical protein